MANKLGNLQELLISARMYMVPDGSNIGTLAVPIISNNAVLPAAVAGWLDWDLGRVKEATHETKDKKRSIEWGNVNTGGYDVEERTMATTDVFKVTTVDSPLEFLQQLEYGLATPPVANVAQTAFARKDRQIAGWARFVRVRENGTALSTVVMRVRIELDKLPKDSSSPSDTQWMLTAIKDADPLLSTITLNPA